MFKAIKDFKGLLAVEKVSLIYNAFTTLMIIFLFNRMDHPTRMIIERVIIVGLTACTYSLYRLHPCKLTVFVRVVLQMSFLAYWYPDTYEFNRLFPNLDHLFAAAEQFLFHCQPSVEFCKWLPSMWFSEPFNFGYFCYYPMIAVVTIYYFLYRFQWFEKVSFVLVASFFIYYLIYIFIPVAGPQFYFPAIGMDNVTAGIFPAIGDYFSQNSILLPGPGFEHGFFYNLVELSQAVGERPTAAFPSSHVGIATIVLIMAYRAKKSLGYLLLPIYILLCGATVYIQAHYLIDVLAGWISSVIIFMFCTYLYKRYFATGYFKKLK
jgi:membrane-associated phospholipid phosphatase